MLGVTGLFIMHGLNVTCLRFYIQGYNFKIDVQVIVCD